MRKYNLDTVLIEFQGEDKTINPWTIRNAVEGCQIFGGIGSGKSTGSGAAIARAYLSAGFGGLVLTVKNDEKDTFLSYAEETGRLEDVIVIEPGNNENVFNFLEYESKNLNGTKSYTDNLVHILKTVIQSSAEKDHGKSDDAFWESALDMLISNSIDLCLLAYGEVTVKRLYDIVQGAPIANSFPAGSHIFQTAFKLATQNVNRQISDWTKLQSEEDVEKLNHDDWFFEELICESIADARTFNQVAAFFQETYCLLHEKTRSIIDFSFSGFLFRLLKEPVYSLFCKSKSKIFPEDCLDGKIVILNLPVKTYHKVGRDCQIMFKYIWQRAMEKRKIENNDRPVFLWADESQHFLHEYDAEYQATARSSMIATVYLSQNLPNYYAQMGGKGDKAGYKVKSFLGTLATKIFHANADIETNKYASDLIGDAYRINISNTESYSGNEKSNFSASETKSKRLEKRVRPEMLGKLRTGSPANDNNVDAFIHTQGNILHDGKNHCLITFKQKSQTT
jgi:type IV secretory pathway TraG/TraD family ATPase VirD4